MWGEAPRPPGAPDICAIQVSGANEAPKYIHNAWVIFWDFLANNVNSSIITV